MKLYIYLIERENEPETMAGYFIDSVPVPMVCDDRQSERLDGFAEKMANEHGVKVKRVHVETVSGNGASLEEPKVWMPGVPVETKPDVVLEEKSQD